MMDSTFLVVSLLCAFGVSPQEAAGLRLSMTPDHHMNINPDVTTKANVLCVLRDDAGQRVPLVGCQFRDYYERSTWQFNEGRASPNYTDIDGLTSDYQGQGLQRGECGVALAGLKNGYAYILGCRVRPATGGWQTATTLLQVNINTPMQYTLGPRVTLALAGSDVMLRGEAQHVLDKCWFTLPPASNGVWLIFHAGYASAIHKLGRYLGAGLTNRECGATLLDVQPGRSGFVRGLVTSSSPRSAGADFNELIVATAPESPPILTVLTTGLLFPGDILEATCLAENSRPAANITWHVGEDQVRSGVSEDGPPDSEWRWDHDPQSVQQRLRLRVLESHHGKTLFCRAGHLAWPSGFRNSSSLKLRVNAPDPCTPSPCRGDHTVCHAEGRVAVCGCQEHYVGSPPSCRPECVVNTDCSSLEACVASRCVDPCKTLACGRGAMCDVTSHQAKCKCSSGFIGDPNIRCVEDS